MIKKLASEDRGHADHGWLDARHTFSFADYHNPEYMGFRALRVINEDRVKAGKGFGMHPHRDMEILTYILDGELKHEDSMGNGAIITPGEVQYMSAGSGVYHSEVNPSPDKSVHLMQIWLFPNAKGLEPKYDQRRFDDPEQLGKLQLIASPDGRNASIEIRQDVSLYAAKIAAGDRFAHALAANRYAWLQVAKGQITLNDVELSAGDGAAVSEETLLNIQAKSASEFLLFDLN